MLLRVVTVRGDGPGVNVSSCCTSETALVLWCLVAVRGDGPGVNVCSC